MSVLPDKLVIRGTDHIRCHRCLQYVPYLYEVLANRQQKTTWVEHLCESCVKQLQYAFGPRGEIGGDAIGGAHG